MTDLRRIDVNLIVVLDAILTEMNLTRAGEAVGMSQPAVSGALARLRQQYGDPLLVRKGRVFELTELAEALKPIVTEAMTEIQRTFEIMPTFDPKVSTRTFSIAASDYVLSQMTGQLLALIEKEAPGVNISFDSLPPDASVSPVDLLRRDVIISGDPRIAGKRKSLFSDRFVCIVDEKNPRLRGGKLSLADLEELRFVRATFGEDITTQVDQLLSQAGVVPRIGITVRGFVPVPFAVADSTMIGFVPERLAEQYKESLGLVIAETPLPPSMLIEAVHWHPSKTSDPALKWLIEMLRKTSENIEGSIDE
jgi:LysR family nod box-dependent transcriptional activator